MLRKTDLFKTITKLHLNWMYPKQKNMSNYVNEILLNFQMEYALFMQFVQGLITDIYILSEDFSIWVKFKLFKKA